MPGSAEFVQRMVHAVEAGTASVWLRRALVAIVLLGVAVVYLYNFRGLATSQAMDQAQIGRSLAAGHGFHTNYIRLRAITQLQAHGKDVPTPHLERYLQRAVARCGGCRRALSV
jgi:hypothetical protein